MENLDAYRNWLLHECGRTETTVAGYMAYLRRFETWLACRYTLAAVPLTEVRDYVRTLSRSGVKSRTVIKAVNCIRSYLGCPFIGRGAEVKDIELPRPDHRIHLIPNATEVQVHVNAAGSLRDKAVIALLYSSALREAELCALKIKDIEDWFEGRIRVNCGKGRKDRIVFADTHALAHVWAYLDSRPQPLKQSDWLFPATLKPDQPLRINYVNQIVGRSARRAKVRVHVTPHGCRRYCATHMLRALRTRNNFDGLALVSRFLGHSDLQSTMTYIVFDADERKKEHNLRHPRERLARGESAWISLA